MHPDGPYRPEWPSLENWQVPDWYLDGKFGIFIHWGVYAVAAFLNEWYPRFMYIEGSREFEYHRKTFGPQDQVGYKDLIPMFKAERYDPASWAALFKEAGARFVVPVAEHHDGFQMYESKLSKWNAKQMGPERDLIGDLAEAVRAEGMTFGLSSHRAEHWWFMNGGRNFPSDVQDPAYADFYGPAHPGTQDYMQNPPSEPFLEDWLARCTELVDRYRPQLFWFDWWIEQPEFSPYLRRFAAYYYNRASAWGTGVAINYKNNAFPEKAAVYDVERGQLAEIRPRFWQTDTSVARNSWSYVEGMDYKTPESLIYDLVDIVSKNGAMLLNIGPRADGTIPDEDQAILREIGAWLKVNGEAIYGTRHWTVYGEGPTPVEGGYFTDGKDRGFTREDLRFTQKDGVLYVTVLAPGGGPITVRSLAEGLALEPRKVESVELLGGGSLPFVRDRQGLRVELPDRLPSRHASAFKVRYS